MTYLQEKDVASWYRGCSIFQLKACNSIFFAIRDDLEQNTAHRVLDCLILIGLNPIINEQQTKFLLRLSRGNDLAFLWFLMEMHYKTPGNDYSVNEQLIMSSIAHLDMITTLRELDRVLPPGHPSKKYMDRCERMKEKKKHKLSAIRKLELKKQQPRPNNPYYWKLVRLRQLGKTMTISRPDYKVIFRNYAKYSDPNYIISNESNRWYADYHVSTGRRIVNHILNAEIANIFENTDKVREKMEKTKILCEHHKVESEAYKMHKLKLFIEARKRCLENLDVDKYKKVQRLKKIVALLEKEINTQICRNKKFSDAANEGVPVKLVTKTNELTCLNVDTCNTCMDEVLIPDLSDGSISSNLRQDVGYYNINIACNKPQIDCKNDNLQQTHTHTCECLSSTSSSSHRAQRWSFIKQAYQSNDLKGHKQITNNQAMQPSVPEQCMACYANLTTPNSSELFFEPPKPNRTLHFNYEKIFNFKDKTKRNIKKKCIQELCKNVNMEFVNEREFDKTIQELPVDTGPTVLNCAEKVWQDGVKVKSLEMQKAEEKNRRSITTPLGYTQKYFDPNDAKLMDELLQKALKHISRNRRFVLAGMPDSYKLPFLREWIAKRYGKYYTSKERERSFRTALQVFKALDKFAVKVRPPNSELIGKNLYIDYSCRRYLTKKVNFISKQYYDRLNAIEMELSRIFWFALSPYLYANGEPRNTFFAYMPPKVACITRFRPWKRNEFNNVRLIWDQRRKNLR